MVHSVLGTDTAEYTRLDCTHSLNQDLNLRREPSFSCWCVEDGRVHFDQIAKSSDASIEDFDLADSDFELPLLHQSELENRILQGKREQDIKYSKLREGKMHLNGGSAVNNASFDDGGNGTGQYVPFDVENASLRERSFSNNLVDDSNLAGDREILPPTQKSSVSTADVLKTLFFILVWYTFSTFLTLYNKTLLGDDLGKFPAPLLMNTVHFGMQAILSNAITWYWSHRFQPSVAMSWKDYFVRVVPTALGTALDINLSNASLVFISVTFATMCKSASPIFLLLFAFAFRLESPSIKLLGIILVISFGILLTVAKETEFEFWGFVFVMLAAVMSGFRWCMTQILLQKEAYGLKNPLTFMSYVTPMMAMATGLLSLILDPWNEFRKNNYFNSSWHIMRSCLLMLLGGTLAFFMVLTEYVLVSVTSAVTVTIAGVVKEAVTILVAVFYFHEGFTWFKGAGLITIMVGVSLFNWYKYEKLQKVQANEDENGLSSTSTVAGKYVILEEMDDQEDGP